MQKKSYGEEQKEKVSERSSVFIIDIKVTASKYMDPINR